MKKIVHIITALNDGGAEAVLYRLCKGEVQNQHYVVSLMGGGKYAPLLKKNNVKVSCLNMPPGKVSLSGLWKLWCILKKEKPDVVQTWMYHANLIGGILSRLSGIKNVFWGIHHTVLEPGKSKRSTIFVSKLCAKFSSFVPKLIVCCAEKSREIHAKEGYDVSKLVVVSNGYDLSKFSIDNASGNAIRNELCLDNSLLLGMIGRFDPAKDHSNLLKSLSMLDFDFNCLLVGPGMTPDNRILAEQIHTLGLSDKLFLMGPRADIPNIMNALDLHLLSSRSEAFPNVLAEAMACGTPCVSTDVGDANVIIGDTGWVVPAMDAKGFAQAVIFARDEMRDKIKWNERCISVRDRIAEKFSLDKMIENYIDIWRR
ncbi:glycosyltransferase [Pseudoalteromonas sp. BDTF-M6]|uniref:glycosyltransferase family 4 protein n=1 Tax=Pseudoalteromonas sp. BDTF-M6 TaxID=2796132 RepID=UPI0032D58976